VRSVVKTAALLCVFLAVAGISAYFTLRFIIKSEDTVIVPELVGRDLTFRRTMLHTNTPGLVARSRKTVMSASWSPKVPRV